MMNYLEKKGLTMIELLIVISIIGVLSGLMLNVINVNRQRNVADDSVRVTNMQKLIQAFESFNASNGRYVNDPNSGAPCNADYNPFSCTTGADLTELQRYLTSWPSTNATGQNYLYYSPGTTYSTACISVPMANSPSGTTYFKYVDPATATGNCKGKIMQNCTTQCSGAISTAGCVQLGGTAC